MRSLSLSGISSDDSDTESFGGPDESWLLENKDIVHELENVGLKTPKSVKKALRRRTTRRETHKCSCKGSCSTKICGCMGFGKQCGVKCACKLGRCKNRDPDSDLEISMEVSKNLFDCSDVDEGESDEDFKENKPRNIKNGDVECSPLKRPTKATRRTSKHPKVN